MSGVEEKATSHPVPPATSKAQQKMISAKEMPAVGKDGQAYGTTQIATWRLSVTGKQLAYIWTRLQLGWRKCHYKPWCPKHNARQRLMGKMAALQMSSIKTPAGNAMDLETAWRDVPLGRHIMSDLSADNKSLMVAMTCLDSLTAVRGGLSPLFHML